MHDPNLKKDKEVNMSPEEQEAHLILAWRRKQREDQEETEVHEEES